MLEVAGSEGSMIRETRSLAKKKTERKLFPINWQVDYQYSEMIDFKGYTASFKTSTVTGLPQLYYNHSKPMRKKNSTLLKILWQKIIRVYVLFHPSSMDDVDLLEQNKNSSYSVKEDSTTIAEVTSPILEPPIVLMRVIIYIQIQKLKDNRKK